MSENAMVPEVPEQLAGAFPARPADLHKYTAGVAAIAGGSRMYPNAPAIAALGARAAGAGLVRLFAPEETRFAAAVHVPEAVFAGPARDGISGRTDVVAAGMGLGTRSDSEKVLEAVLSVSGGRFVLDADALSIIARWRMEERGMPGSGHEIAITPHSGEAAVLLGCTPREIDADRSGAVRELAARYNAIAVLKGPCTLVAAPGGGELFACPAGNPFMAAGGMGDLLSGAIAARWAYLANRARKTTCVVWTRHGVCSWAHRTGYPCETGSTGRDLAALAVESATWLHSAAADSLARQDPPMELSIANMAARMASIRIALESRDSGSLEIRRG